MDNCNGKIQDIVYYNKENGYSVARVRTNDKKTVVFTGTMPYINIGETIDALGEWIEHPVYGRQFKVSSFEKQQPEGKSNIEEYLASGAVKGIGPILAGKIVRTFGEETLNIIEKEPHRLAEIKGITLEKASIISDSYKMQYKMKDIIILFNSYGLSTVYAYRAYKLFGETCIKNIKENPYCLLNEEIGITFKTADRIALETGFDLSSYERISSGIVYILSYATLNGDVFLYMNQLKSACMQLLNVSEENVENAVIRMSAEKIIVMDSDTNDSITTVYLYSMYNAEKDAAEKLLSINEADFPKKKKIQESYKKIIKKKKEIELSEEQNKAIQSVLYNGVTVITGGPGTGKTTVIKFIADMFAEAGMDILLAAPTGRAAKRIQELSGYEAKTIHRLLEIEYLDEISETPLFKKNEDDKLEAEVIIIDEMSMVDIVLVNNLTKAISNGTKLILVGDMDQLPSVGPGTVLRDIINSNTLPVIKLTTVYRQAAESMIITNAHKINRGEIPELNCRDKDFFCLECNSAEQTIATVIDLCKRRLPEKMKYDFMNDIQVLSPSRKGLTGITELNVRLQDALNPQNNTSEKVYREYVFRKGDRVMQNKNDYNLQWYREKGIIIDTGVYNGDMGLITEIDNDQNTMTVAFDDGKFVDYEYSMLEDLEPAYATTVHKSQGGEYPVVILALFNNPPMLLTRNLLYTAVTRAKKLFICVGRKENIIQMVNNQSEKLRNSFFSQRLKQQANASRLPPPHR